MDQDPSLCYGPGSVAGAVIGTFLATCFLIAVAALLYRRWRRNKGKHLVLVTDPEIVEEAYAFDNPCFKDATPAVSRNLEKQAAIAHYNETAHHHHHHHHHQHSPGGKDNTNRWSAPWANFVGWTEKRRTLDDSCLGPKAMRVSVVGLKSRDFTGLGFNVCGNMREGIFVKDLLHRGPASESGRIHPGDRISSVKISFRSMVYEDALTILSYASPYDVELEVESGGPISSKPSTLLKKTVGPSPTRICHPLYRSQSIPDLSQSQQQSSGRKHGNNLNSKRTLFDLNDSTSSTIKSTKSTPGSQSLERQRHQEDHKFNHHKFGIKVLPALDGTVHRIENQNEHNTNVERRNSKKLEKRHSGNGLNGSGIVNENLQQRSSINEVGPIAKRVNRVTDVGGGFDVPDRASELVKDEQKLEIPSEVPAEVHNAAMAARRNRKSSNGELLQKAAQEIAELQQLQQVIEVVEAKSPQKGKRKAPAPPSRTSSTETGDDKSPETSRASEEEPINEEVAVEKKKNADSSMDKKIGEESPDKSKEPSTKPSTDRSKLSDRRNSESDTDSELQNNFTTIELNPSDITIHHTPVPEAKDDEEEDENYRKAASLGDLSKYESKASSSTLERAQSLDMTDSGLKKRKAPMPPPEDIHESTEDLTKLDQIERRKLKKSSEWGTLEDAIWSAPNAASTEPLEDMSRNRKKSNGSLERSKSNVEIKSKDEEEGLREADPMNVSDGAIETSLELYNLPLSKKLTQDFIRAERLFNPDEDNALARIVNDGDVVKAPLPEDIEAEFVKAHPFPEDDNDVELELELDNTDSTDAFEKAVRYFDVHSKNAPLTSDTKVSIADKPEELYKGMKEVVEEPISKVILDFSCPYCEHGHGRHSEHCTKKPKEEPSYHQTIKVESASDEFETHYAKPILNIETDESTKDEDEEDEEPNYEFNTVVTVNNTKDNKNVSSVNVSSDNSPPLPTSPMPSASHKKTYITEIKVSPREEESVQSDNEEIVSILEGADKKPAESSVTTLNLTSNGKLPAGKKPPVPPRRSDAARFVAKTTGNDDKQVVYVSEYKKDDKNYIYLKDNSSKERERQQEINPWGNGSSPSQPVTNIVLSSSGDEKIVRK